jgi:hypothetical protein
MRLFDMKTTNSRLKAAENQRMFPTLNHPSVPSPWAALCLLSAAAGQRGFALGEQ